VKPDLHTIATPVLELAAKRLRARDGDQSPIDITEVKAWGLEDAAPTLVEQLGDVNRTAALMALQATLNERTVTGPPPPQLVWTGTSPGKDARDTRVLLKQLFASAQESVLIAGYSFDHGKELFAPLHDAMTARGVRVRFYINIEQERGQTIVAAEAVDRQVRGFLDENWSFGDPVPEVFFDERILTAGIYASLHAKCVVVDERLALVTSSNFTERGQRRNIEVGVLMEDQGFASSLVANFRGGSFQRAPTAGAGESVTQEKDW